MITAIVPAFNEQQRIAETIAAIRAIPEVAEVIVVDDGSADGTAENAEKAGARVIRQRTNRGKGAAIATGVASAAGDILLLLDADLGSSASEARALLEPVLADKADMTIATFPVIPGKGGGLGLVVGQARDGIREMTGVTMQAPLSGQRAITRKAIESLGSLPAGFGLEVAMTVTALKRGLRVLEVPTTMTHRVTGRSLRDMLHRARQFMAVRHTLAQLRSERR